MDAPREDLYRAVADPPAMRAADGEDGGRTLFGHFAVFDAWTEIHSWFEGDFMESIEHGAFAKTMAERRDQVKVLYDHGHDFQVGNKVLGPIEELHEDKQGAYYEVSLLDTSYVADLLPGLREGLYGASFRFSVLRDEWADEPGPSDHNPKGLPERRIKEVRLFEFGPVTFPAYEGATAGVRSLTDYYHDLRTRRHPAEGRADDAPRKPSSTPREHLLVIPHAARRERMQLIDGRPLKETTT